MKTSVWIASAALLCGLTLGCQGSGDAQPESGPDEAGTETTAPAANPLVGTWRGEAGGEGFSLGAMSLMADGTYTAYAVYEGQSRGFSGRWSTGDDGALVLDGTDRSYGAEIAGDSVTLTDSTTGMTSSLSRVPAGTAAAAGSMVGTWRGEAGGAGFTLGAMTLMGDGTYTAYADYDGQTRGFNGRWSEADGSLMLDGTDRSYGAEIAGDQVTLTDATTGTSTSLSRVR